MVGAETAVEVEGERVGAAGETVAKEEVDREPAGYWTKHRNWMKQKSEELRKQARQRMRFRPAHSRRQQQLPLRQPRRR